MKQAADYEFELDMEIDPDELDVACLEQANLHAKYGRLAAAADKEAAKAAEGLKTVRSELILHAGAKDDIDGAKPTAQTIEAYYRTHPKYIRAKDRMLAAEYQASQCRNAIFSVQQRGRMLDLLIELLKSEYFEGPAAPASLTDKALRLKQRERVVDKARAAFAKSERTEDTPAGEDNNKERRRRRRPLRRRSEQAERKDKTIKRVRKKRV